MIDLGRPRGVGRQPVVVGAGAPAPLHPSQPSPGLPAAPGCARWYDATVFAVDVDLGRNNIAKGVGAVFDDSSGSFIAGGFDAEN